MKLSLSIIMYHYVRNLETSKYPDIKGLDIKLFIEQLDYLSKYYNFIKIDDLLMGDDLPLNPVLLTFDDGYIDNYDYVFPELMKRRITGAFFPVVESSQNGRVLDVNKIHFILACVENKEQIVDEMNQYILNHKKDLVSHCLNTAI